MRYTHMGKATRHEDGATFTPDSPYVMVIDDDGAILSVVMLLLETEEYAGLGLTDSQKVMPFLYKMETNHLPAVVLLDLMMPVVSGYEIAAQMMQEQRFAQIPIVVMTADNRVRSIKDVPGATDWMSKPFEVYTLLAKLERYLSRTILLDRPK
jgi:CheY-like chemotaxis protein